MPVQASRRLFTVHEYYRMAEAGIFGEDDRVELLSGEIVEMTPIGSRHAAAVSRLIHVFTARLSGTAILRVQDPLRLDNYSEPQPDLAIVRLRQDFYRDAHPDAADVLLLIEVADTSGDIDRTVKIPLYARSGVAEVWVVDLQDQARVRDRLVFDAHSLCDRGEILLIACVVRVAHPMLDCPGRHRR